MEIMVASIEDARKALGGIGRTKIYEMIKSGDLRTVKVGRRTLVKTDSIRALVEAA